MASWNVDAHGAHFNFVDSSRNSPQAEAVHASFACGLNPGQCLNRAATAKLPSMFGLYVWTFTHRTSVFAIFRWRFTSFTARGAEHRRKVADSLIVGAMVLLLVVPVFAAAGAFDFVYPSGHRKDRWDLSYFPASIHARGLS